VTIKIQFLDRELGCSGKYLVPRVLLRVGFGSMCVTVWFVTEEALGQYIGLAIRLTLN